MKNYDVVVVGAGVTGCSTAYYLKMMNPSLDILLVDQYCGPCQGNSAKSAAKIRDTVTSDVNLALCHTSIEAYKAFEGEGANLGLDLMGYLWLMSEAQKRENEPAMQLMSEKGVQTELLSREDLQKKLPQLNFEIDPETGEEFGLENVAYALFGANCGSIDPGRLCSFYEQKFRELGGQVSYDDKVTGLRFDENGDEMPHHLWIRGDRVYGVKTEKHEIHAGQVVLATGAYSSALLEERMGIQSFVRSKKRQLYEVELNAFDNVSGFKPDSGLPFVIVPAKGIYFWLQHKGKVTIGCADGIGRPFKFEEDPTPESNYFNIGVMPLLIEYFPDFQRASQGKPTAGMYNYSVDGVPNIDRLMPGLILANGSSGRGIMEADAVGRITAARTLDEETAELFGEEDFQVSRLSVDPKKRNVDKELFTI